MSGLIGVIALLSIFCSVSCSNGKLLCSHVIYRHGDRTPVLTYPTDPYNSTNDWPVGWGQLTVTGEQQQVALGKWLRARYGNLLLSQQYLDSEIYIHAAGEERTLLSAYCNLAGLYAPYGSHPMSEDFLKWQQFVHTMDEADDYLLGSAVPFCPPYEQALENIFENPGYTTFFNEHKTFYDYLTKYSGAPVNISANSVGYTSLLRDVLFVESIYGKMLPLWTKEIFPSAEIDNIAIQYYKIGALTPFLAKIRSGYLLKEILDHSTNKSYGTPKPNRNVWMYSTHDNIICNLLTAMGMFNDGFVQYAACLLFEVRLTKTGPHLEMFYKESSASEVAAPLFIPNCGFSCPLSEMYHLFMDIIPTQDFDTVCQ